MRKTLLVLLVAFAFLTACGNEPVVTEVPVVPTVVPTVEPTALPTEEPTVAPTEDPDAWRYICGTVTTREKPVYQKSYDRRGRLRVNAQGNWILKPVPRTEVAHYFPGDSICFYFDPFQVDNMREVQVSGTRGAGYYFPISLIDFVK